MSQLIRIVVFVGVLLIGGGAMAADPVVADSAAARLLADRVEGRKDAPVTIIDYSSLTCPHCAQFHMEVLPRIKKEFIDTGKVKLVFRDFPLDGVALAASMLARCVPEDMYFRFLDALFGSQAQWSKASNPRRSLSGLARLSGMTQEAVDGCLGNEALMKGIQAMKNEGHAQFGVDSTPTFIINGVKLPHVSSYEEIAKVLIPLVAK
ncbi:MAG: DsbA family protein [Alphaproteobacteria bacterium]